MDDGASQWGGESSQQPAAAGPRAAWEGRRAWSPAWRPGPAWQTAAGVAPRHLAGRACPSCGKRVGVRRRLAFLLIALVLALLALAGSSTVSLVTYAVRHSHDDTAGASAHGSANPVAADQGPQPAASRGFRPSRAQRIYFMNIYWAVGKKGRVVKWDQDVVRVFITHGGSARDRRIVDEIVGTLDRTIAGPRFVYSGVDPDIVVTFVRPRVYYDELDSDDDTAGWCQQEPLTYHGRLTRISIVVCDGRADRVWRSAVLYHEFGHAVGLDHTRDDTYTNVAMFYRLRPGGPTRFTNLDLSAIRMLYDPRVTPGMTRRQVARVWFAERGATE